MTEDRSKILNIWKLADQLAYKNPMGSRKFLKEEMHSLTSQLRRAALPLPTSIACPVK
jgi:hypothetical protein